MATCNVKFLSELFDLSQRRIEQLVGLGHVIRTGRGQYSLIASIKGYIQYLKELAKASEHGLTEENRKIKELKRMEMQGKLINVDDLTLEFAKLFTDVKTRLLAVSHKCSQEIAHIIISGKTEFDITIEVSKILQKEHYEVLKELSRWKSR